MAWNIAKMCPCTASPFIVKQIMLSLFAPHIASEVFNLTSFSVISDPFRYETIEWDDAGGPTFDRVVANEHGIYVRMYMENGVVFGLAIMKANNVTQTKYEAFISIVLSSLSVGDSVHIVIEDVTQNIGTTYNDAAMIKESTTIYINNSKYTSSRGTWTSTIEPDNETLELDCVVVEVNGRIVTAACDSETTWDKSVFNRIPIVISGKAQFGYGSTTNQALFGTSSFPTEGSVPSSWDGSTLYNVTGHESNLTIGNQVTIMNLPTDFVSHLVDIGAQAYMGNTRAMIVPPGS